MGTALRLVDIVWLSVFSFEFLAKIVALGFIRKPYSYCRRGAWQRKDADCSLGAIVVWMLVKFLGGANTPLTLGSDLELVVKPCSVNALWHTNLWSCRAAFSIHAFN